MTKVEGLLHNYFSVEKCDYFIINIKLMELLRIAL